MFYTRDLGIGATIDVNSVPLLQKYIAAVLLGIAIWSSVEMLPIIYFSFTRYSGLYFWSMVVANMGVLVYATGFVLNNFQLTANTAYGLELLGVDTDGVGPESCLVLAFTPDQRERNDTSVGTCHHTSTAITTIGSNSTDAQAFLVPYSIMERVQVTVFFTQELILSWLYIWSARRFLTRRRGKAKGQQQSNSMMIHLILSNIIVIALDTIILLLEFKGLYFIQVSYKAFVYAVKLKCEIGILNRLVNFVKASLRSPHHHHFHHEQHQQQQQHIHHGQNNPNSNDGHQSNHNRHQNFQNFQLSSLVEREWETTLRNTFGVPASDEEKKSEDGCGMGGDHGGREKLAVEEKRHVLAKKGSSSSSSSSEISRGKTPAKEEGEDEGPGLRTFGQANRQGGEREDCVVDGKGPCDGERRFGLGGGSRRALPRPQVLHLHSPPGALM